MTDLERNQMMKGARTILEDCLSLKKGEKFLIVTDPALKTIAQVLADTAYERGIKTTLEIMDPRERDGQEPPPSIAEAMKKSDVIVCPVSISITHTNAVKEVGCLALHFGAELGVGLNPKCKMTGIMLDDEGVLGSAHIGIGSNFTLGGNLKAAIHYDLVLWHPTIKLDEKIVMKNGNIEFSL